MVLKTTSKVYDYYNTFYSKIKDKLEIFQIRCIVFHFPVITLNREIR